MRIIDKRGKDFYDGIMLSLYRDHDFLFVREEEIVWSDRKKPTSFNFNPWNWNSVDQDWPFGDHTYMGRVDHQRLVFVGFCGRVYPAIETSTYKKYINEYGNECGDWCYEYDYDPKFTVKGKIFDLTINDIPRVFEMYKNPPRTFLDHWQKMMEEKRSPVFVASPGWKTNTIEWNPHLSDYNFHHVMDQHQMAQKIYQFFSNLASPEVEIPEVDDVTMAEIKGFDKKTSFRKLPTKKK